MAADGTPLQPASAFAFTIDGAITTVEEEPARRRDRDGDAAKRARDGGLARREEEADATRGWSSAVEERGLALRRRGGSASCSHPRGGLIIGEGARRREEATASGALGAGAGAAVVAAEEPLVDPAVAFFCLAVL
ncbi:hypothetical protein BAE44_0005216 [Dichanthelium oligosanthes]|uniref:Uncharacterized protein n=1 Tax=Dichanthelium oligosanthes TaxID=888268 RepID=A0A1E5W8N0_9POAL|nr:hypothetical protein BAE44_0005216 [Dichanthelium oligosanthes]